MRLPSLRTRKLRHRWQTSWPEVARAWDLTSGVGVRDGAPDVPRPAFQIILVSSSLSDREESLFLSTDEGATFQKQLIPFSVDTLIFHPKQEDKVLAYSKDGKVSGRGWAGRGDGACRARGRRQGGGLPRGWAGRGDRALPGTGASLGLLHAAAPLLASREGLLPLLEHSTHPPMLARGAFPSAWNCLPPLRRMANRPLGPKSVSPPVGAEPRGTVMRHPGGSGGGEPFQGLRGGS